MNCPVCHKDARSHIYYCAQCAAYVHEKCWKKHVDAVHNK